MEEKYNKNYVNRAFEQIAKKKDQNSLKNNFYENISKENPVKFQYFQNSVRSDVVSFNNPLQIPIKIYENYADSKYTCSYGILTDVNRYYCIVDNKAFFWPLDSNTISEEIEEKEAEFIISIEETSVFITETDHIPAIAIATPKYIRIFPFENNTIDQTNFNIIKTRFITKIMHKGPAGILFCGGSDGFLYTIKSSLNNQYSTSATNFLIKPILDLIGYQKSPICGIETDETNTEVCYWTEDNQVVFLQFDIISEQISHEIAKFHFKPQEESNYKIIGISCPGNHCLEIITNNGTRYIYGNSCFEKKQPDLPCVIPFQDPDFQQLGDNQYQKAFIHAGCLVLISNTKILFCRTQLLSTESSSFIGYYSFVDLPGKVICARFSSRNKNYQADAFQWQQTILPPSCFVITMSGTIKFTFQPPLTTIRRLVCEFKDDINCDKNFDIHQILISLILIAQESPELRNRCFYLANRIVVKSFKENDNSIFFSDAIYTCLLSLINDILDIPLLAYTPSSSLIPGGKSFLYSADWYVSDEFSSLFDNTNNTITRIAALKQIVDMYINQYVLTKDASILPNSLHTYSQDHRSLIFIKSFLLYLTELLNLAKTLSNYASLITEAIRYIIDNSESTENELFNYQNLWMKPLISPINKPDQVTPISETDQLTTLNNFMCKFFIIVDPSKKNQIAEAIIQTAPTSLKVAEKVIVASNNELEIARFAEREERMIRAGRAMHGFLNASKENPERIPMEEAFTKLCQMEIPSYIYQLAIAIGHSIDKHNQALFYYKEKMLKTYDQVPKPLQHDIETYRIYQKVSQIYMASDVALNCKYGLEELIPYAKQDELFAYVLYSSVENRGNIEDLISCDAPYIEEYVSVYCPHLKYQVYEVRNDTKKALDALYENITRRNAKTSERMQWITRARILSNGVQYEKKKQLDTALNLTILHQKINLLPQSSESRDNLNESTPLLNSSMLLRRLAEKIINAKTEYDYNAARKIIIELAASYPNDLQTIDNEEQVGFHWLHLYYKTFKTVFKSKDLFNQKDILFNEISALNIWNPLEIAQQIYAFLKEWKALIPDPDNKMEIALYSYTLYCFNHDMPEEWVNTIKEIGEDLGEFKNIMNEIPHQNDK